MNRRLFAGGALVVASMANSPIRLYAQTAPVPPLRKRMNVQKLATNDPFFAKYATAVQKMHTETNGRNWRRQALVHLNHCVHQGQDFFHWHRHYINQFEQICGELIGDPTFALPYWDWTANKGKIPDPFYDMNSLNVVALNDPSNASSPNWAGGALVSTVGARGLVKGKGLQDTSSGGAFTAQAIKNILGFSAYDQFWPGIEGTPHGTGHVVVGSTPTGPAGHMGSGMSSLDPIFWLHHCNVDRLWERWRKAGNKTPAINKTYAGMFVDAKGSPVTVTAAQALDADKLGFQYDPADTLVAAATFAEFNVAGAKSNTLFSATAVTEIATRIGQTSAPLTANVGVPAAVAVNAAGLSRALFSQRVFRSPEFSAPNQLSAEGGRVVLKLSNVTTEGEEDFVVNVFINCPYLASDTPFTDQHFVGTFGIFGGGHAGHAQSGATIVLDASTALRGLLRDGHLTAEQFQVQFMAVPAAEGRASAGRVTAGKIEAFRA